MLIYYCINIVCDQHKIRNSIKIKFIMKILLKYNIIIDLGYLYNICFR